MTDRLAVDKAMSSLNKAHAALQETFVPMARHMASYAHVQVLQ